MFDKKVMFLLFASAFVLTGLASGYFLYKNDVESENNHIIIQNGIVQSINKAVDEIKDFNAEKTTENTKMIYKQHYLADGVVKVWQKDIEPELINKTKDTIQNVFDDWSVIAFNSNEVVLEKTIEGESPYKYVLKEHNGFIAVFNNDDMTLKEITKVPVESLPFEEQQLLQKGIFIKENENILKILQDYES